MDQYRVVLGHWVIKGWYWLVFGYTGSEQGGTGCQCDMLPESKWFTRSKPSYHSIFEEGKSDDAQTYLFVDLIPSVEGTSKKIKFLSNISKAGTGGRTPAMEIVGDHLWSRCDLS